LRTAQSIRDALRAGADIAVIGNGFVENPNMLANWNDGI
jgi:phosphoribosylformimino-5-aminoimidazole carboxamide ribonucleotide (ProFAR) isomerase